MKRAGIIIFIIGVLILGSQLFLTMNDKTHGSYPGLGGSFILDGVKGKVKLEDFKGRVLVIYLGFTHCPDICPTALDTLGQAFDQLDKRVREKVQAIFISVDHKRDTAKIADEYIKFYIKDGLGLAGSQKEIDELVKRYGAYYQMVKDENSAMDFSIDHTSRFYIIGKKGKLQALASDIDGIEKINEEITRVTHGL